MTSSDATTVAPAVGGAGQGHLDAPRRPLPGWVLPAFIAVGLAVAFANLFNGSPDSKAIIYDALAIGAASGAVVGVIWNEPAEHSGWWLVVLGVALFAIADAVFDLLVLGLGRDTGYPFADALYLSAYPILAAGLYRLSFTRFRRDAAIDGAIVALAASAVVWQWVITPVLESTSGVTAEQVIAIAYPIMDIVLVIAMVHAVFTLSRWSVSAWLLFGSLGVLLVTDTVYARLVADGAYNNGTMLDFLWPVSYLLLAAAALHPSMRRLWDADQAGLTRYGHSRMILLGAALFAAPAVVILDESNDDRVTALAALSGVAAILVAWRIARLVADANQSREVISESEARFRALVQNATDIVSVLEYGGGITYASPAIVEILGCPPDAVIGTNAYDLVHPDDITIVDKTIDVLITNPSRPVTFEMRVRNVDGSYRWIQATCTNQLDEPSVRGIVGNFRDIDDRKRTAAFSASETLALEMLLAGRPLPHTLRILLQGLEEYVGGAHASIRLAEGTGTGFRTIAAPTVPDEFLRAVDRYAQIAPPENRPDTPSRAPAVATHDLTTAEPPILREIARRHGLRTAWSLQVANPDDANLIALFDVYLGDDRTPTDEQRTILERTRDLIALTVDRAAQARQLGYLALHDTLTGLPNRALVVDRLQHALARLADRNAMLAVLFIDLDRFKIVNDGLGHDTGDELLVEVGKRLTATVRRQDTVARLGGDEFIVICEDLADELLAQELASRTAEALSAPFTLSRAEVSVTASVGIAATRRASDSPSRLLRDADAAMYRAKGRGGARWELFDEAMHTQAVERLLIERALRQALAQNELRVVFQRQFDLTTREPVCDETLLRWAHPTRGLVSPADFLPVAEETGMIIPIGWWVLGQACAHARQAELISDAPQTVSINMSGRNLLRADYPALVEQCLREHELDPARLCLEISEIALLDDLESTNDALRALKDLGVRLAIDDFGTGGSSLTYLRQFPFDELKIDSSFVAGLGSSAADDAIVAATIDMAHALGMVVAAEGVETELQRERLVALGCDRAQGYLLAEPVSDPGSPALSETEMDGPPRLAIVKEQSA